MLKSEFWQLIDTTRKEAGGDPKEHLRKLKQELNDLEAYELVSFQHWFEDYYATADSWPLRAAAHIIGGGCSDEGFADFKGWLVAQGEKVFEAAVANPESLAKVAKPGQQCAVDGFTYLARTLWVAQTGKAYGEFPQSPLSSGKNGTAGEAWTEDELPKRFPKLSKKFKV